MISEFSVTPAVFSSQSAVTQQTEVQAGASLRVRREEGLGVLPLWLSCLLQ